MKNFLGKTLYLWISIICFGLAIWLLYLLNDFFNNGGGIIRVKGILAPLSLALFGLISLWKFIKKNIAEKNYAALSISVLIIAGAVWSIMYFSSTEYKTSKLLSEIQNDKIDEDTGIAEITKLLNEDTPEATEGALKCLDAMAEKGSSKAWLELGVRYYLKKDFGNAEKAFSQVCLILEPLEVHGDDYSHISIELYKAYMHLGNIYNYGLTGENNRKKALMYYERASHEFLYGQSDNLKDLIDSLRVLEEPEVVQ